MKNNKVRDTFETATKYYVGSVIQISYDRLNLPGLCVGSVRDLAEPTSATDYFLQLFNEVGFNEIADRGAVAGTDLGLNPANMVRSIADRVLGEIAKVSDDTVLRTPRGPIRMVNYPETNVFELTVHTRDLQTALGQELAPPQPTLENTMKFIGGLVLAHGKGTEVSLPLNEWKALSSPFRLFP